MKRIDALRSLMGDGIQSVDLYVDFNGAPTRVRADLAIKLYDYLAEDLCDPKEDPQKPKEKLDERKADKPIPEKVVAGSQKREKIDMGKLIALAKAGRTKEWIADEMGVSVATVYNYLKKAREEGKL